jgi:hypothetical protein
MQRRIYRVVLTVYLDSSINKNKNNKNKNNKNKNKNKNRDVTMALPTKLVGSGDYKSMLGGIRKDIRSALGNKGSIAGMLGEKAGAYLGGKAGMSSGASATMGRKAGNFIQNRINKLIGSGDYTTSDAPMVNSLFPGSSRSCTALASFSDNATGVRIKHREYIEDVFAGPTNSFSTTVYPVQPGL